MSFFGDLWRLLHGGPRRSPLRRYRRALELEALEPRTLLSLQFQPSLLIFHPAGGQPAGQSSPVASAFTPAGIVQAYGFNQGGIGDGSGMTIAIVDAYDDPKFVSRSSTLPLNQDANFLASDLHQFDLQYNLPEPAGFFTKVNQTGGTTYPSTDPARVGGNNWEAEEALDVEWVHSLAPGAHIILVEANDNSDSNLYSSVGWAAAQSGAQVVSMSWGGDESSSDPGNNAVFTSPAGHGVTFVASTGDTGQPGGYPAFSPNVLAVGGTSLTVTGSGNYSSESGWSDSGGGLSQFETQPAYQSNLVIHNGTQIVAANGMRATPDVSFDADPATGVSVYDAYNGNSTGGPWYQFGGTSFSAPSWAALIAIVDQARAAAGLGSLDGPSQTLPWLYALPAGDFHDVTSGNNGFGAGVGYDLVTGLGSPIVNKVVADLSSLHVISSTPAAGAIVSTPPTSFVVTFNEAIANTASVSPGIFTVNGNGATGVSFNPAAATFTFTSSPVTVQGVQNMAIAANTVTGQDGSSNSAFAATFSYDLLTLAVAATNPAVGGTLSLPASSFTYDVTFNEPIDPATVTTSNLTLSQGTVTAATVLAGNQTARYTISGLTTEGTLTITLPAGQVKDAFDNPGFTAFSGTYAVDVGTAPFPTPPTAVQPAGSLIYTGTVSGLINTAGDTDNFTLNLDPGATVTLLIQPTAGTLQPTATLTDPTNAVLGTTAASAVGQNALLQTVAVATGGTYTITVGGASSTTGGYTVSVLLNAAQETESALSGASDNTLGTAQSIDSSFLPLPGGPTGATRGAVLGTGDSSSAYTASAVTPTFTDISTTGTRSTAAVGNNTSDTLGPAQLGGFTFSFFGTTYTSLSFSTNGLISFTTPDITSSNTNLSASPPEPVIAVLWDHLAIDNTGTGTASRNIYWQVIGTGPSQQLVIQWNNARRFSSFNYFTFEAVLSTDGTIQFNYAANLTSAVVLSATVGVKAAGTSNPPGLLVSYNQAAGPLVGAGLSTRLSPPAGGADYYSFSLNAGDTATLALSGLSAGTVALALQDANGNTLAQGNTGASNVGALITDFVAPAAGTYYALVTGTGGTSYSLVVTRNAEFSTESNDTFATAQAILSRSLAGVQGILGYIGSSDVDFYPVTLADSASLQAQTSTPFDGSGQPVNTLDPLLQLYTAAGTRVAADDNSAGDGHNALLNYTVPAGQGGTYYLGVASATPNPTTGEYVLSLHVSAATALHFVVSAPASATAGTPVLFTVTAEDSLNDTITGYSGTVAFTSSDGQAKLPSSAPLTNGIGTFSATLKTAGNQTITATDTATGSMTGTSGSIMVSAAAPAVFRVTTPASVTAGTAFNFTVTALDSFNNVAPSYTGTVHFSSSDGAAVLPGDAGLTNGVGTFSATLKTAGSRTLTATDTITGSLTTTSNPLAVGAAAATHFLVNTTSSTTAGQAITVTVTALDAFGNTATGYGGTVHFSSSDSAAALPSNSTLANGQGSFNVTLKTAGSQTLTAVDTASSSIGGTSGTVTVSPAAVTRFLVSAPTRPTAGSSLTVTVTAQDAFHNTVTGYGGSVRFTSSDGQATLPASGPLSNGIGSFTATLKTAGNQTLTAIDTVTSSITGTSNAVAVSAASVARFQLGTAGSATAGIAFSVTVTALDAFHNQATGYTGMVRFSSTDGAATLPANASLSNGAGVFSATLRTAGTGSLTVTDTLTSSLTGTSNAINVGAAAANHFVVNAPPSATAGTVITFRVTALDAFNNTAAGYSGTVHFTSSDTQAALPADAPLTSGVGTFNATLKTPGTQMLTASDRVNSALAGSSGAIAVAIPPSPPPSFVGTGVLSASVAFDKLGHEVQAVVFSSTQLWIYDSSGAHFIGNSVLSAGVAFDPSGQQVLDVVFAGNLLYSFDATGAHFIGSGVLSVSVAFDSQGRQVTTVVYADGSLYVFDSAGVHLVASNVQSASLAFDSQGRQVLDLVYTDNTLYQFDSTGAHFIGSGVQAVGVAYNPLGQRVLDVVFASTDLWQY